ncbi:MAG: Alpha-L-rhamnosidase N-terminal domain [Pseudomonadota bacterium]|jgi:hypothetical protein
MGHCGINMRVVCVSVALSTVACGGARSESAGSSLGAAQSDSAVDTAEPDAALDASNEVEASDLEVPDASETDAGDIPLAAEDAGDIDAGMDAGTDASEVDAGPLEASADGATDAGDDAGEAGVPPCPLSTDQWVPVTIRLTADDAIGALYVDGTSISLSDAQSSWGTVKIGTTTLSTDLGVPHVIAVEASNLYNQTGDDRGFIAELTVEDDRNSPPFLHTDRTWKVAPTIDSSAWTGATFDDSNWATAVEVGAIGVSPWGVLADFTTMPFWIWSYDPSASPNRPTQESLTFRRVFYVDANLNLTATPGCAQARF